MKKKVRFLRLFFLIFLVLLLVFVVSVFMKSPSNDREWAEDQRVLSVAEFDLDNPNKVMISNIRNFTYRNVSDYDVSYYDRGFDLDELEKVYFIVEPFAFGDRLAHTFLSFEFEDDVFVAVSVEIRKEVGESFSPVKGLFREFEVMYVVGDERDLIKLRSIYRNDSVYVYPINTTEEKVRDLFVDVMGRVNYLRDNPEFYNSVTNTCTTALVEHANKLRDDKISLMQLAVFFPGFSDKYLNDIGLIDVPKELDNPTIDELREYYKINERAFECFDCSDFSLKIREWGE